MIFGNPAVINCNILKVSFLIILQPFNGLFSNLDFTGARDSEWQWHQLSNMQVCTSLQTDNHSVFYRPDALPAAQPCQSTEGTIIQLSY